MFDAIVDFFSSDFLKDNLVMFISLLVLSFIAGLFLMWLYTKFFSTVIVKNKNDELKKLNNNLSDENKKLMTEIDVLKSEKETVEKSFAALKKKMDNQKLSDDYSTFNALKEIDNYSF